MNPEFNEEAYGESAKDIPAANVFHQEIDVEASFDHAGRVPCFPHLFRTKNGREVEITKIGLIHPKYNGLKTQFLFDVTDGAEDFRLCFDTENLKWYLEWEGDRD